MPKGPPRFWREAAAAVVSPPTGFNRLAFGDRFAGIFDSHKPDYYSRFQAGGSSTTQNTPGASSSVKSNEALLDFSMDYGLPGKPGYTYTRPFDYFNFQAIASSANGLESVNTRGLLIGKDYEAGPNYRGVWGVYGSYDYLAPQLFRVSSTALSVGTTGQWGANSPVKLQGTALLGAGYTAVGTIHDAANTNDNHYGVSPQALVALRLSSASAHRLTSPGANISSAGLAREPPAVMTTSCAAMLHLRFASISSMRSRSSI
jgi:hypothetical protein